MSDHPAVYLPAKIVDQDEDGYIYEAGARRHKRPFVSVEPVGTLTVDKPAAGWSFAAGDAVSGFTKLPPGKYLIISMEADDE